MSSELAKAPVISVGNLQAGFPAVVDVRAVLQLPNGSTEVVTKTDVPAFLAPDVGDVITVAYDNSGAGTSEPVLFPISAAYLAIAMITGAVAALIGTGLGQPGDRSPVERNRTTPGSNERPATAR